MRDIPSNQEPRPIIHKQLQTNRSRTTVLRRNQRPISRNNQLTTRNSHNNQRTIISKPGIITQSKRDLTATKPHHRRLPRITRRIRHIHAIRISHNTNSPMQHLNRRRRIHQPKISRMTINQGLRVNLTQLMHKPTQTIAKLRKRRLMLNQRINLRIRNT